ncbi:MAG TPA: hypothetical protein VL335_03055 [Candidatus Paceibacterota bacterium]|jgi:hypothetical protein|nr:hypothetical protein [Candidatus Paceibacterota bacterium]
MRRSLIVILIIVILGAVGAIALHVINNFTYTRHITLPPQLLATSSDETGSTESDTGTSSPFVNVFGQKNADLLNPASSTVDMTSWKTYTNSELGFSVKYPKDLVTNADYPDSFVLAIPKDKYFHWPLLDDAKITITATSTCPTLVGDGPLIPKPVSVQVGNYEFARYESAGAAAGNLYREMAFDYVNQGTCYHLSLFVHGANGAGLYVSGQALISQYDAQHQSDLDNLIKVFMGIVHSFSSPE